MSDWPYDEDVEYDLLRRPDPCVNTSRMFKPTSPAWEQAAMPAIEEAQKLVTLFQTQHPGEKIAISADGKIGLVRPTYRIKPLVWDEPHPLNGRTNGDLATHAGNDIVTYEIQFVGGKWRWSDDAWSDYPGWIKADSLESAKAAAEAHWQQTIKQALEEV